jgi:hypothetical protein
MGLSVKEAERLLGDGDVELVPAAQAGIIEVKRMQAQCLDANIPALLGSDDHCTSGCSPQLLLLVREADLPKLAQMMRDDWVGAVLDGGTLRSRLVGGDAVQASGEEADPPCPACNAPGPLAVDGTCNGCGLQLG